MSLSKSLWKKFLKSRASIANVSSWRFDLREMRIWLLLRRSDKTYETRDYSSVKQWNHVSSSSTSWARTALTIHTLYKNIVRTAQSTRGSAVAGTSSNTMTSGINIYSELLISTIILNKY